MNAREHELSSTTSGFAHLVLACVAVLLAAADTYVVVLALPDIMVGVGLDVNELQRAAPVISGFLLGYVAMLPLIGRLSDLFGRVPVLVASLALFALGSLLTAASYDLAVVVVGRFLQGVGGGGLVPATLALVADRWPPHRRGLPLGVVGAVQELGSVLGPLYGAAILLLADWRAIFWANLAAGLMLAAGIVSVRGQRGRTRSRARAAARVDVPGLVVGLLALVTLTLTLTAPDRLATDVTVGLAFVPFTGSSRLLTPIGVTTLVLAVAFVLRQLTAARPLVDVRRLPAVLAAADFTGALLLGLALGGVVVTFAVADPATQVISPAGPWLLAGSAACAVAFVVRQRRTANPVVPRGALAATPAWGSLVVSFFVGAALIAALVDVPVFARATRYPDSQLGAALVLVRFLVALPVGALVGGWLSRRVPAGLLTAAAMLVSAASFVSMATWNADALSGPGSDVALVLCGFGFGVAIAPVNAALLAATAASAHGVGSALLVVARMVGMLVGLSTLTAVGLRQFFVHQGRIGSPAQLCPDRPGQCPAYLDALRETALVQLHTIFAGAAVSAVVAAVVALLTLRRVPGRR
ncbi:MFS transporter [Actinopolymorpha pittospori]|uniref:MFS family permease n=1 Tax=Actinopolymorpha pittospori TaxID=648752 RepID=A0A927MZI9_9ACTN|nr:MFS transporter [Actinopolymorpha pittospori]MBE1609461.1 MFS family permease [Actinopolymorpha pittospori]